MAASRSVTHALICPMLQTQHNLLLLRLTVVRSGLSARRLFHRLIHMATAASGHVACHTLGGLKVNLVPPHVKFFRESLFSSSVSWPLLPHQQHVARPHTSATNVYSHQRKGPHISREILMLRRMTCFLPGLRLLATLHPIFLIKVPSACPSSSSS